jgi:2-oxoglutarate dehydrogenase E1 component
VPAVDGSNAKDVPHLPVINAFAERAKPGGTKVVAKPAADAEMGRKRTAVQQLIAAYRNVGCPLGRSGPAQAHRAPQDSRTGAVVLRLQRADQETVFDTSNTFFGKAENMTCASSCMRCARPTAAPSAPSTCTSPTRPKALVAAEAGSIRSKPSFNADKKKHILDRLTAAEGLERFLHTKYVGQKRFSLEGGESFIAAMDELIQRPAPKACRKS